MFLLFFFVRCLWLVHFESFWPIVSSGMQRLANPARVYANPPGVYANPTRVYAYPCRVYAYPSPLYANPPWVYAVWHRCISTGRLPAAWLHVRITLLDKSDGGKRPLAIAAIMYRVCMSATLRCLRSWIAGWAPPTLYGGIPGRGTDGVHSALFGALHQQQAGRCMAGAKADIQRCFDSVDFGVAFLVFDHLGAPAGLTEVLRFFYAGQTRWFISRGCVHPTPVRVQRGLLQGCPASPALLKAIMAIWSLAVTRAHPRIGLAIYLDDRSLWAQRSPRSWLLQNMRRTRTASSVSLCTPQSGSASLFPRGTAGRWAAKLLSSARSPLPPLCSAWLTASGVRASRTRLDHQAHPAVPQNRSGCPFRAPAPRPPPAPRGLPLPLAWSLEHLPCQHPPPLVLPHGIRLVGPPATPPAGTATSSGWRLGPTPCIPSSSTSKPCGANGVLARRPLALLRLPPSSSSAGPATPPTMVPSALLGIPSASWATWLPAPGSASSGTTTRKRLTPSAPPRNRWLSTSAPSAPPWILTSAGLCLVALLMPASSSPAWVTTNPAPAATPAPAEHTSPSSARWSRGLRLGLLMLSAVCSQGWWPSFPLPWMCLIHLDLYHLHGVGWLLLGAYRSNFWMLHCLGCCCSGWPHFWRCSYWCGPYSPLRGAHGPVVCHCGCSRCGSGCLGPYGQRSGGASLWQPPSLWEKGRRCLGVLASTTGTLATSFAIGLDPSAWQTPGMDTSGRISFPWSLQGHECSCRFDSETTGAWSWGWILHSGAGTARCSAVGIYCCAATKRGDMRMVGPLLASLRFSKWGLADSELAGCHWRLNCDFVVQVDVSWNNNNNNNNNNN